MNKVILMGRLTRDPDVRYTGQEDSTAIARFSLAVDRRIGGKGIRTRRISSTAQPSAGWGSSWKSI